MSQIYKVQLVIMSPFILASFILLAPFYGAYKLISTLA